MKSGTNQFHGNVFEDLRNDKLNANNWANNWNLQANGQATPRPPLRWNEFGGTFGGPIKKDKLFFFTDYQGLRQRHSSLHRRHGGDAAGVALRRFFVAAERRDHGQRQGRAACTIRTRLNAATGLRDPYPE